MKFVGLNKAICLANTLLSCAVFDWEQNRDDVVSE